MGEPLLHPCSNCAALIDVSEQQPFELVSCPVCGNSMRVRTQFNNFALEEMLGAGGMGAVYKAMDVNLNRLVALKVVRKEFSSDAEYLEKFEREARITASVNHPNVVKVYSFGSDHGLFYIAMELVDKGSLDDLMSLQGRVAELQVLQVGIQVAQGLDAAHRRGLIHRDVKPGNILFADAHTAKIVDFGLALLAEQEAEARGEVWGTPYYVAPEKLNHEPEDFRSDIYSLGGTLFHAVAGRPPYEAETASMVALKHIKSQKVSLQAFAPDVSSATAYVINRMLQKEPDERYQSYEELIEHLTYARTQLESSANGRSKPRVGSENKRQEMFFAAITLTLLAVLVGCGLLLFVFRGRIFPGGDAEPASETTSTPALGAPQPAALESVSQRYEKTRVLLAKGSFKKARQDFKALAAENPGQPLHNWLVLHEGLSAMLEGKVGEGRLAFKALQEAGPFSAKMEDRSMANFFIETGRVMGDANVQGIPALLKQSNYEALALLCYGLSDFEAGRFEAATECLDRFRRSDPKPPSDWINQYKGLCDPYISQLAVYKQSVEHWHSAQTPESRVAVAAFLESAISKAGSLKMREHLGHMIAEVKEKIAQENQKEAVAREARQRIELELVAVARKQFEAACAGYDFTQAKAAAEALAVKEERAVAERNALLKKAQWLQRFHELLIRDVSTKPFEQYVVKRNGARLPAGANAADSLHVEVRFPNGLISAKWKEISPQMIFIMASSYLQAEKDPARAAERQWLTGVFACQYAMTKEGGSLLQQAAKAESKFAPDLALFPVQGEP